MLMLNSFLLYFSAQDFCPWDATAHGQGVSSLFHAERQTQRFSSLVILDSVRLIILATMLLESKQEERAMYGME